MSTLNNEDEFLRLAYLGLPSLLRNLAYIILRRDGRTTSMLVLRTAISLGET